MKTLIILLFFIFTFNAFCRSPIFGDMGFSYEDDLIINSSITIKEIIVDGKSHSGNNFYIANTRSKKAARNYAKKHDLMDDYTNLKGDCGICNKREVGAGEKRIFIAKSLEDEDSDKTMNSDIVYIPSMLDAEDLPNHEIIADWDEVNPDDESFIEASFDKVVDENFTVRIKNLADGKEIIIKGSAYSKSMAKKMAETLANYLFTTGSEENKVDFLFNK